MGDINDFGDFQLVDETAEIQAAYDRLHDAIHTYLTGPSNETLKAVWRELTDGSAGGT